MSTENKKYFWFKLKEDFFMSKEMKILRKMPSGADMILVFLKLQLQALKTNGVIEIDGLCNTIEEELSVLIDEDAQLIKMSLIALNKFSMLNIDENDIKMLLHEELVGKETASTIRSRKSRAKAKNVNENMLQCNDFLLQCNNVATKCNTEIERDRDIDTEIEREIEKIKKENTNKINNKPFEIKVLEELNRSNFKNIDKNSVKSILKYTNSMKQIMNVILHIENTNKAKEIKTLVALLRDNDYEKFYKVEEKKKNIDKKKNENTEIFSYENNLETIENKEIREKKEKLSTEIMTDFTRDKQEKMFLINKLLSINNLQEILKFQIELEKLKTS